MVNIKYLEDAVLVGEKILVFGDFHVGYDGVGEMEGLLRVQFKEIIEKLDRIFELVGSVEKIVVLGDLKHEFGGILDSEWSEGLKLLDYLSEKGEVILIKGNHDNILKPIAKKRGIELKNFYKLGDVCFMHGDKLFEQCLKGVGTLFVGHLHPAISLNDGYKNEKYKCFLKGDVKGFGGLKKGLKVYVLPSFSPMSYGYDLSKLKAESKKFSFILEDKRLKNFEVIIYNEKDDKIYEFGKLKKLIEKN
ncbi:metallophosphoesterase [archaeon]|jgi:uncharacterized protein|nr:metallophosphoesterase [archaeon]